MEVPVVDVQAPSVHSLQVFITLYTPMLPGSGIEMGFLGGGSSSNGCTGPLCTQSTSKYL